MYTYKDVSYTDDQIKKAAEQSNMTVKEYLKKIKGDKDPEPKIKHSDLLDPNFQQDTAAGADVVSQPMTASQAGVTELPSVDTSSGSVKVKLPKDKKYGKIFEIPNFKKQSPKDIANAYNQMYGGKDGGFEFTSNVNNVTIKALNGESTRVCAFVNAVHQ